MKRKIIVALGLALIATPSFAQNFMPLSVVQSKGVSGYSLQSDCEKVSGEQCLDVGDRPEVVSLGLFKLDNVLGDDQSRPKYGPESEVVSCANEQNCHEVLAGKKCPDNFSAFIDATYQRVYCTELLGYEQKVVGKSFAIDKDAVAAYREQIRLKAEAELSDREKKKLARERLASCDPVATTIAGIKAEIKQCFADIKELLK